VRGLGELLVTNAGGLRAGEIAVSVERRWRHQCIGTPADGRCAAGEKKRRPFSVREESAASR
jgi:hypothetical protein